MGNLSTGNIASPIKVSVQDIPTNSVATEIAVASISNLTKLVKSYLSEEEIQQLREAYRFADEAHLGQFRSSGAPYITHPIAVAEICATWHLDIQALMAALLHDVIEDQDIAKSEIAERFGPSTADLVDGLTKLEKINFATKEQQQAESFRKMLLAMNKDVRVILVKIADRIHNMRTLDAVSPEKKRRVAKETMEIYAPIANRLGLNTVVRELHDLCFEASHPNRYNVLRKAVMAARGNRREVLSNIEDSIKAAMPANGLAVEISSREKSLYSIYKKMCDQKKSFSDVLDIYGFRVIVNNLMECYIAMGTIHQLFRPIPGKFKDYIAIPKINGYQSLHTTITGPYGTPIEFQIRSRDMHHISESGVAAHWIYKNNSTLKELKQNNQNWLNSLIDIQKQTGDSSEFLENVKTDLFADGIYALTPKGKIFSLPRGATPIDFAYAIHTEVGNKASSAKINGEVASLKTEFKSGDTVEIITSEDASPNVHWLNYARTGKARSEIRHYLKTLKHNESIAFGRRLLEQSFKNLNVTMPDDDDQLWQKLFNNTGANSIEEILMDIGIGKRLSAVVAHRFALENKLIEISAENMELVSSTKHDVIHIHGNEGAIQLSSCCCPLPGDQITASIRTGSGMVIHTSDCLNIKRQREREPDRLIEIAWASSASSNIFKARIDVNILNEKGVFAKVAAQISNADGNILQVNMPDHALISAVLHLTIQVHSRDHLARLIRSLRKVPQVEKINRVKSA